ncbi:MULTISPECIES: hypothetical protein [Stenotrophomonas]|jgi:hypothetical protein|uniref:Transmembrane protein n=1 Tax=Stenotrophomonas aracearum TaxID=3003272 RepID=A0ABY9YD95_9GAMM|nr:MULTISPECIES: hypothetical protein [unclassified Stenotrophomonas]WNH48667.1 hypothetical protein PDM28_18730 [Stenotrophomonas sp. A5588]
MNKGIPYLMAALVALTLSAGWAAPVLALFDQVAACLDSGGHLDLLQLRCAPPGVTRDLMLGGWVFWLTAASVVVVVLVATRSRPPRRRRLAAP